MTVNDALNDIVAKLQDFDRKELLCGLPILAEQDRTWGECAMELQARANLLAADGLSHDVLDALGAHVIAAKVALTRAEEMRVESGAES